MTDLELIRESVAKHAAKILDANDRIWDYAELAFHEHKSAELLCRLLEEEGFTVQRGLAEIPHLLYRHLQEGHRQTGDGLPGGI